MVVVAAEEDWPIVVTNRCADACAAAFGIAGRDRARAWLHNQIGNRGTVTDHLPAPVAGRRSPSGFFLLVPDTLVLPLAEDRDGAPQWIATNCLAFPAARGGAAAVDPLRLAGRDLLDQVNVLPHAVQRFQQRAGGDPVPELAHRQLLATIAPTVRATARPPSWCRTRAADFYLVAGDEDEFCLPCRAAGGPRPFDVITCIHRATDLFALDGAGLGARCRFDPAEFPPNSREALALRAAFEQGGRLSWHRPPWARRRADARWWIVFDDRRAAAVAWQPDRRDRPLLVLGMAARRSLLARLLGRLFGR